MLNKLNYFSHILSRTYKMLETRLSQFKIDIMRMKWPLWPTKLILIFFIFWLFLMDCFYHGPWTQMVHDGLLVFNIFLSFLTIRWINCIDSIIDLKYWINSLCTTFLLCPITLNVSILSCIYLSPVN
jgi:hypothetical protein